MTAWLERFKSGAPAPRLAEGARIDALFRKHRLRILVAITVGYAFAYTCRLALSVVKKPLIDEGIFSPQDLGLIGSALFYSYAFAKLVNGFLADHANIKIFFATGVIASALINIGMGFSTILWVSVALWALNGWFQGFGAPSGAVSLTAWFSNRERGRFYGIWSTAHSMGEGLTYYVVALFVAWLGWRAGFWVPGIFCILAGLAIYALMQDRPVTLGLPPVADWKNDHLAQLAPPETKVADAAVLDPAHSLDLGARGFERDGLHHALRDRELGHPLPAGSARLRARGREPLHGHRHHRRHRRLPAVRLHLRYVVRRTPAAGQSPVRDRRTRRSLPDLLRPRATASR